MTNKKFSTRAGKFSLYNLLLWLVLLLIYIDNPCHAQVSPGDSATISIEKRSQSFRAIDHYFPASIKKFIHKGTKQVMDSSVAVSGSISGSSAAFHPLFRGRAAYDTVPFNITKTDQNNLTRYLIKGTFFVDDSSVSFSLSDSLIINYKRWTVSPGNRINYSDRGLLVSGFLLSYDSALVSLSSQDSVAGRPVNINIQQVDLKDLAGMMDGDTINTAGLLDAKIQAKEFDKTFSSFTGTASVRQLVLMQQPVGDVQFQVQMTDPNTIHATVDLEGKGNRLSATGDYCLNNGAQQLEALLNIKQLQLPVLNEFIKSGVRFVAGSTNGVVALTGDFKRPQWRGSLNFDSAAFSLNQFGTTYYVDQQKISLDYPAINFSKFVIKDSLGNPLTVSGSISSKAPGEYELAMKADSHDFTLISAPKAINNQIYGYAGMDAKLSVTGTTTTPIIEGDISLNEKTNMTLVLPEKNTNKDAAGSVVRFIDKDTFSFSAKETQRQPAQPGTDFKKFLNYKLNIRTDKQSSVTIAIDPSTGDVLKLKGLAQLNAGIDTNRNMVMSGTYQLDSGYYELNYQFLRRRFNIIPGSTIRFSGGVPDAQINISAEYTVNTATKDLLGNEVGSVDPATEKSFNRKIPFRVIMSLKGSLKKPVISFNIDLPEKQSIGKELRTTVENKLVQLRGDVAATNKQVFALLVLDRFVGEQSTDFFKGNGGDFSDISTESVSQFLSAALDKIASDLFKGINADLNLRSYKDFTINDGPEKTDLNIEVSKNFLNDRLTVTVGKNFGIESRDASTKASQQKASRFLPDVTVNYKLSTDGKYMIRSYKKNPFEVILDGYVVETGLAFILTLDYEKFNEVMKRKNKKAGE